MAHQDDKEAPENGPEQAPQETSSPEAAEAAPTDEGAPEEAAPAEAAPAEEPAAAQAPEEQTPAEEPAAAQAAPAARPEAPAPAAEEEEKPGPKELRKRSRSRFSGEPGPERSATERAQERAQRRARKAVMRSAWRRKRRERDRARAPASGAPAVPEQEPLPGGERKVRRGVVVSSKADKTITVKIDLVRSHPVYGKVVRNTGTLHAHDERNQAGEGDVVRVVECRPLSRNKRWRLLEVVEKAR